MQNKSKLVYGVGINDLPRGSIKLDGKTHRFYKTWQGMLQRCYDPKWHARYPTYIGCSVVDEWKLLSNFKKWFDDHYVDNYHLDKDFYSECNKVYGPQTCNFIPPVVNTFITDSGNARGDYPIGVSWNKVANKFRSTCSNPFTKKNEHLGYFVTTEAAHQAWKKRKHQHAITLAETYKDLPPSILDRLVTIFAPESITTIITTTTIAANDSVYTETVYGTLDFLFEAA